MFVNNVVLLFTAIAFITLAATVLGFASRAEYWKSMYNAAAGANKAADTNEVVGDSELLPYGATVGPLTQFGNSWLDTKGIYAVVHGCRNSGTKVGSIVNGKLFTVTLNEDEGKCVERWMVERAAVETFNRSSEQARLDALFAQAEATSQVQPAHPGWDMTACMDEALREFDHATDPALHGVGTAEAVGVEETEFLKAARLMKDGTFYTSPQVMDLLAKSGAGPSQEDTASIVFTSPGGVMDKATDCIPAKKHEFKLKGAGKTEQSRKRNNV